MKTYTKNQNYRRAARQGFAPRTVAPLWGSNGYSRYAMPTALALAILAGGGNL